MTVNRIGRSPDSASVVGVNVFTAAQIWGSGTSVDDGAGTLTLNPDGNYYEVNNISDTIRRIEHGPGFPATVPDGHMIAIKATGNNATYLGQGLPPSNIFCYLYNSPDGSPPPNSGFNNGFALPTVWLRISAPNNSGDPLGALGLTQWPDWINLIGHSLQGDGRIETIYDYEGTANGGTGTPGFQNVLTGNAGTGGFDRCTSFQRHVVVTPTEAGNVHHVYYRSTMNEFPGSVGRSPIIGSIGNDSNSDWYAYAHRALGLEVEIPVFRTEVVRNPRYTSNLQTEEATYRAPTPSSGDRFSEFIRGDKNGDFVAIGRDIGALDMFKWDGNDYVHTQTFAAASPDPDGDFGPVVSLDNNRLVSRQAGFAEFDEFAVFKKNDLDDLYTLQFDSGDIGASISATGISGDYIAIGQFQSGFSSGQALSFWERDAGLETWTQVASFSMSDLCRFIHPANSFMSVESNYEQLWGGNGDGLSPYYIKMEGDWMFYASSQSISDSSENIHQSQSSSGMVFCFKRDTGNTDQWQFHSIIRPSSTKPIPYGEFGWGMDLDIANNRIAIPAYGALSTDRRFPTLVTNDGNTTTGGIGCVFVFELIGDEWVETEYITRPIDPQNGALFGRTVQLSGDLLLITDAGAVPLHNAYYGATTSREDGVGSIWAYRRLGGIWRNCTNLVPSNYQAATGNKSMAAGQLYDQLFYRDSNSRILLGSREEFWDGVSQLSGVGNINDAGLVYQFNSNDIAATPRLFDEAPTTEDQSLQHSQTDTNDSFGESIDSDGDYIIVGCPNEDSDGSSESDNTEANAGAAFVFKQTAGTFAQTGYLKVPSPSSGDRLGRSVTISGVYAAVGSEIGVGDSVEIFKRTGETWAHTASISGAVGDSYSNSVSMSGDYLAIGSDITSSDQGAVYVYKRDTGLETWSLVDTLVHPNPENVDVFGAWVSMDGDLLAIGCPGDDSASTDPAAGGADLSGAVFVFERDTGLDTWSQQAFIKPNNIYDGMALGFNVSLDGTRLVSTAVNARSLPGSDQHAFSYPATGVVFVFEQASGNVWNQTAFLQPDSPTDSFGRSVQVKGDRILVGDVAQLRRESNQIYMSEYTNTSSSSQELGLATLFELNATVWERTAQFGISSALAPADDYSEQVALLDAANLAVVTSPGRTTGTGIVYSYDISSPTRNIGTLSESSSLRLSAKYYAPVRFLEGREGTPGAGNVPTMGRFPGDTTSYNFGNAGGGITGGGGGTGGSTPPEATVNYASGVPVGWVGTTGEPPVLSNDGSYDGTTNVVSFGGIRGMPADILSPNAIWLLQWSNANQEWRTIGCSDYTAYQSDVRIPSSLFDGGGGQLVFSNSTIGYKEFVTGDGTANAISLTSGEFKDTYNMPSASSGMYLRYNGSYWEPQY